MTMVKMRSSFLPKQQCLASKLASKLIYEITPTFLKIFEQTLLTSDDHSEAQTRTAREKSLLRSRKSQQQEQKVVSLAAFFIF